MADPRIQREIQNKLMVVAKGDFNLVYEALHATKKIVEVSYRYGFLWLKNGARFEQSSNLEDVVNYIKIHMDKKRVPLEKLNPVVFS